MRVMKIAAVVAAALALPQAASFSPTARHPHIQQRRPTSAPALSMSVPNSFDTLTSGFASIARLPFGVTVSSDAKRMKGPYPGNDDLNISILYDVENDMECRLVRERISELDSLWSKWQ